MLVVCFFVQGPWLFICPIKNTKGAEAMKIRLLNNIEIYSFNILNDNLHFQRYFGQKKNYFIKK